MIAAGQKLGPELNPLESAEEMTRAPSPQSAPSIAMMAQHVAPRLTGATDPIQEPPFCDGQTSGVMHVNQRFCGGCQLLRHSGRSSPHDISVYDVPGVPSKLGYISLPKCGSLNMRDILRRLEGRSFSKSIASLGTLAELPANTTFFSFVRNPWARMHSVYNMQRDQWLANNNGTLPAWALEFDDFAVNPDGHHLHMNPRHWSPMFDQLLTEDGHFSPHYLGRIEALNDDFLSILQLAGADSATLARVRDTLEHHRPVHHREADYSQMSTYYAKFYTNKTRKAVGSYSRVDAKLFCYTFST